ncbi:MAG TPA: carboxypeptidase-like regulatory domain-containing protein [Terracidiphilus sp.]|nr:carboxypeptidase-like regulatory domain-containing protein [Terracidiphilus sp.]
MRRTILGFLLIPVFFAVTCVAAFAQANSDVTGIVTDQTGAVVAGASITLTDPATAVTKSTISSDTGLYDIPGLNAAKYNMKVTAKGFQTFEQTGIVVDISRSFRVDVKLTIGAETQTVTVEANALAVQGDSNVVSTLINEQQITELATNGRNVVSLAALGLGVSGNLPDSNAPTSVGASYTISFNGLNQAHNIWMIDGGEAYDRGSGGKMSMMPSQDALGEFQVLASNYPPDYGISSGGTVTMSIKSGTQKFHGELWEFDRNDALDAHTYFDNNNGQNTPKPELRYNVYGGNVGGPLFIPHVYNSSKQRTFFFVNEEWRKEINGASPSPINAIPSADLVTSATTFNFVVPAFNSKTQLGNPVGQQLTVPYTNDPAINAKLTAAGLTLPTLNADGTENYTYFPNNTIPGSLLDSNALLFNTLKNIPAATASNDTYTPSAVKIPTDVREDLFRIDHTINDKWSLFGHFIHDAVSQNYATVLWNSDNYPSVGSNFVNPSYMSVIKLTGALKPNVLLEAAFNYDGNKIVISPVAAAGGTFVQPSGWNASTYFTGQNQLNRLPNISLGTFGTTWGPGSDPWKNGAEDYNEVVSLSVTKGQHQMKFGGGYNRYTKNQINGSSTEGSYTFGDGWNTTNNTPSGLLTGDSYLDFLMGLSTTYSQANADLVFHYVNNTISAYAEDNWHINPRLSLQYGLRYDALPHVWERNNAISNFVPSLYQSALAPTFNADGSFMANSPGLQTINGLQFYMNGIALAGQGGIPRGLVHNDFHTYQPRVGFSYDLTGTGKTVLRGGAGAFFERMQGNDIYDIAGGAPFESTPSASNVELTNTSYNWQSGGAASKPLFTQGPNSENMYYPAPGVVQYSLGVQHELAPALILVTQYVGNIAWHQNTFLPINNYSLSTPMATRQASAAGTLSTVAGLEARNYPGFGGMNQITNPLTGSYNSFQVGLRQQNKHGLSFEVDYTYSHEIDDQVGSADLNTSSNPWNLKYDKGSGSLDRRNMLNINYLYKLPIFATGSGLAHSVLGGWELSGTVVSESGLPWAGSNTPGSGFADTVGLGGGYTNRANLAGKPHYVKGKATVGSNSGYQWVSAEGFSAPTASWLGGSNLGFGNEGRDAVVGPGRTNFSTSLYKSFAFTERARFELRADSFNTFNHTQFNAFNNSVSGSNFGFVTGAQDPREFEFGGKFVF